MIGKYFSQFEQDKIINILLNNRKNGFFIDIGAYDGVTYSNSCFFEKTMNWDGVCFEPNPIVFKKLSQERSCTLVNGGVSASNAILNYKRFSGNKELEMFSGFSDFFDESQIAIIDKELKAEKNSAVELIKIQTYSLNEYLKDNKISKIDYCSIDTEGGEFEILKTIDFNTNYFSTLTVENNCEPSEVIKFMNNNGFKLIFIWKCDLFFINKKETVSIFTKIQLLKYLLNFHLKKTGKLYTVIRAITRAVKYN